MSPRRSAIVVAVVALPVVVASVIALPSGGLTSLLAALGIACGLAGLGLATVWAGRESWAREKALGRGTLDRERRQRNARRVLHVQGWIGVVGGGIVIAFLVGTGEGLTGADTRLGAVAALMVILGLLSLFSARADRRPRAEADAPAVEAAATAGWVRISQRERWWIVVFLVPGVGWGLLGAWQVVPALASAARSDSPIVVTVVGAAALAAIVAGVVWAARQFPDVWVDTRAKLVRVGSRTAPWQSVTSARLLAATNPTGGTRSLVLILEGADKLRVPLLLRRRGELSMTPVQRHAAMALVQGASLTLPRAPEDPKGKFSRVLYPTHLDADQALEMIARPPRSDQDLPISSA